MFVVSTGVIRMKTCHNLILSVRNLIQFNHGCKLICSGSETRNSFLSISRNKCSYGRNSVANIRRFGTEVLSEKLKTKPISPSIKASLITPTQCSKKRPVRRKILEDSEKSKYKNVFAFATADEYDMERLKEGFVKNTVYVPTNLEDFKHLNILHVKDTSENGDPKEMYIFEEGSVVFWNIPEEECFNILKFIKNFELGSYSESIVQNEQEIMPYTYGEEGTSSDLVDSLISLTPDREEIKSAIDKYTFSNAMVLSVKLGIWESILEFHTADVKLLIEDLKLGKKISITSKEVLRKTGELFSLRHAVNLSSDTLDVPDFYWDLETQEKVYIKMYNYFSIKRRTTVVNEKLNYCLELLDLLASQLNDKHHVRLEWMIIILITVEVVIAIFNEL